MIYVSDRRETGTKITNMLQAKKEKQQAEVSAPEEPHQAVEFRVLAEERFALLLLTADKVLDVHVKAGRGDAVGAQRGLFALLEQQRQEREQWMPVRRTHTHRKS